MALEADCGSSTALEAPSLASTPRFTVPAARRLGFRGGGWSLETKVSKFEIRNFWSLGYE